MLISDANNLVSEPSLPAIFPLYLMLALLSSSLSLSSLAHSTSRELFLISVGPWSGHLVLLYNTKSKFHWLSFWKTTLIEAPSLPNSPTSLFSSNLLPVSPYFTPIFLTIPSFLLTGHPSNTILGYLPVIGPQSYTAKSSLFCLAGSV